MFFSSTFPIAFTRFKFHIFNKSSSSSSLSSVRRFVSPNFHFISVCFFFIGSQSNPHVERLVKSRPKPRHRHMPCVCSEKCCKFVVEFQAGALNLKCGFASAAVAPMSCRSFIWASFALILISFLIFCFFLWTVSFSPVCQTCSGFILLLLYLWALAAYNVRFSDVFFSSVLWDNEINTKAHSAHNFMMVEFLLKVARMGERRMTIIPREVERTSNFCFSVFIASDFMFLQSPSSPTIYVDSPRSLLHVTDHSGKDVKLAKTPKKN